MPAVEQIHYGKIDSTPEEAGFDAIQLEKLDHHFLRLLNAEQLQAASYLLFRNGKAFACRSMGKVKYTGSDRSFLPESIRRIASITKIFTSIAVMKLVEDGKLLVDQEVRSILGEFDTDMHKSITIFHLLTHTSGVTADTGYFAEPYGRGWWQGDEDDNWIKQMLAGPLQSEPGKSWNYSSAGFAILGEIISKVCGIHAENYIIEEIAKPLGMERTFFEVPEHLHDEVCVMDEWDAQRLKAKEDRSNKPPRTGGGLYSNVYDLCKLGQMFLSKGRLGDVRILGRKTIEAMTRNQLTNIPAHYWGNRKSSMNYGLGLNLSDGDYLVSPGTFNHEGAGRCAFYVDPDEKFIAVYIVPTTVNWLPETIVHPRNIIWSGIR